MYASIADCNGDGFRPKAGASAALAGLLRKIAVQPGLDVFAGGVLPSAGEIRDDSFERETEFAPVSGLRAVH